MTEDIVPDKFILSIRRLARYCEKAAEEYSQMADKAEAMKDIPHTLDHLRHSLLFTCVLKLSLSSVISMTSLNRLSRIVEEKPGKREINKIKKEIKNEVKKTFDPLLKELDKQIEREKRLSEEGMYS